METHEQERMVLNWNAIYFKMYEFSMQDCDIQRCNFHRGFNGFHSYFSFRSTLSRMTSHAFKLKMRFGAQCLLEGLSLRNGIIICGQAVTKRPYHNLFFFVCMIIVLSSELIILLMLDEKESL
jgi:hypothetical protein